MPELRRLHSGPHGPNAWLGAMRRSMWLVCQLLVVTLLVFTASSRSGTADAPPMFFNSKPVFVSSRAWQLVEVIGRNDETKPRATLELMRLGGAALPHILPKLDSLQPAARQELLRALAPLAVRMQLTPLPPSPEESEALWLSFWNDHFVDFHSAMARRVVRRYVQGPTASRAQEVRRLDTFALGELVRELVRLAREHAEPATAAPVIDVLCFIATEPGTPCTGRGPDESTRASAERWRAWWLQEHHRFESPNGAERFLAPILQTEYASWVRTSTRALLTGRWFRVLPWGPCLLTTLQFGIAIACAVWSAKILGRARRSQVWFNRLAWIGLALPAVLLTRVGGLSIMLGYGIIGALAGLTTGVWAALYRQVLPPRCSAEAAVLPHVSHLLGVVLASEGLCGVDGLGAHLLAALQARDLSTTIWTTLACAVLTATGHGITGALGLRVAVAKEEFP